MSIVSLVIAPYIYQGTSTITNTQEVKPKVEIVKIEAVSGKTDVVKN
jgi:hypothetical protein